MQCPKKFFERKMRNVVLAHEIQQKREPHVNERAYRKSDGERNDVVFTKDCIAIPHNAIITPETRFRPTFFQDEDHIFYNRI